jgi:type I restriction-modification system DNA methylase subunit
LKSPK